MASQYDGIWETVKLNGHCNVAAVKQFHARIIKAVIKRKDEDVGFKLTNTENKKKAKLFCKVEQTRIRFYIKYYDDYNALLARY